MSYFREQHKFIQNVIENMNLAEYKIGTVTSVGPIEIKFDDMKPPIKDVGTNIFYDERYISKIVSTEKYKPNLQVGDNLLLLQVGKGQKFIVMSKLYYMAEGG